MASRDHGFTLVELAVVVALMAVLIGIAAGVFLGAKSRSEDVAAQASLREAIIAAAVVLNANEGAVPAQAALLTQLAAAEPDIAWKDRAEDAALGQVSASADPAFIILASGSTPGECHYVKLLASGTFEKHRAPMAACTAQDGHSIVDWLGW